MSRPSLRRLLPALPALCLFALAACQSQRQPQPPADIPAAAPTVTRAEALAIARAYTTLEWKGERRYAHHGTDPDGRRVDTPDARSAKEYGEAGKTFWWKASGVNRSMPYKWGGFDTPRSFVRRLNEEAVVYAGDYASSYKTRGSDGTVSRYAAGIDCSGFVSRCWRLERPHSTRELGALCTALPSEKELRPGDIMLCPGVHVVMFLRWLNEDKTRLRAVEAGGGIEWNCYEASYSVDWLKRNGYRPYRYKGMRE